MKTLLLTATYCVGILEVLLAFYFWKTNFRDQTRRVTGFLTFCIGAWVIFNGMTAYRDDSSAIHPVVTALFIAAVFLVTAFVHFAMLFPVRMLAFDRLHTLLLYIPPTIIAGILLLSNAIVKDFFIARDITGYVIPGPLYPLFLVYLVVGILTALCVLMFKTTRLSGFMRRNTLLVFWSFLAAGIPAIIQVAFFESRGANYNSLITPLLSGVWLGITGYILVKR